MLNLLILRLLLVFYVLFLTALLLWNSQNYSGLLWSYKHLSICPHLLLTVFCPGASSEPCPESWVWVKASSMADRVWWVMSFKHEVPVCVTVQTESADCQLREGNRCKRVPLSCSSGRCHFLEWKETFVSLKVCVLQRKIVILHFTLNGNNNSNNLYTDPCDLSDTAGGNASRLRSCA